MKGWEKVYHANENTHTHTHTKTRVALLISDKIDFKTKAMIGSKWQSRRMCTHFL